jgi:hypothetical protein
MRFNSQICTTKEQSERLLALGLKKETADMAHVALQRWDGNDYENTDKCEILVLDEELAEYYNRVFGTDDLDTYCSAWSLHRLWELAGIKRIELDSKDEIRVIYNGMIDKIEGLVKEGYFNKEYLEE